MYAECLALGKGGLYRVSFGVSRNSGIRNKLFSENNSVLPLGLFWWNLDSAWFNRIVKRPGLYHMHAHASWVRTVTPTVQRTAHHIVQQQSPKIEVLMVWYAIFASASDDYWLIKGTRSTQMWIHQQRTYVDSSSLSWIHQQTAPLLNWSSFLIQLHQRTKRPLTHGCLSFPPCCPFLIPHVSLLSTYCS